MSVRHALLALLSEGPKYGLQLRQEFEARTGEVWPLNVGQVYTTVGRLERDGLVASDDGEEPGPQKSFRITPEGRVELDAWLTTPPAADVPPRDELVIKVLVALRLPGVDVTSILQTHRRHLIEAMSRYTRLKEDAADADLGLLLVADAEILRLEAFVRWLDTAEVRLRHRPPVAIPAIPAAPATPATPTAPAAPRRRARATR
ncbi:PadR family transcriptional regulator [Frankia sp. QA3]|uniref:PadR family transcriptional regulator n=1 Tax=Frankia sp. QA3 TaxID=710111 RepID=UPI00055B122E|nr:PadR family transcriptional regulator [Frankia sp. QA3]